MPGRKRKRGLSLLQIENILGEDFTSLTQAKRAFAASTKRITATRKASERAKKDLQKTKKKVTQAKKEVSRDAKQIKRTTKSLGKLGKELKKLVSKSGTKKTQPAKSTGKNRKTSGPTKRTSGNKRQQKKTPSKSTAKSRVTAPKPLFPPRQRTYEMADLPEALQTATNNATLEELRENAADYQGLLKPGEVFGAMVGTEKQGGYTYQAFGTFNKFLEYLEHYRSFAEVGDDPSKHNELEAFKIIRFKAPAKDPSIEQSELAWESRKAAQLNRQHTRHKVAEAKSREQKKEIKKLKTEVRELKLEKSKRIQKERTDRAIAEKQRQNKMMADARLKAAQEKERKAKKRVPKRKKK
jgi:hypothetical protein